MLAELHSYGELSRSQFDASRACQKVRNRIVHGLPVADLNEDIARLSSLLRDVSEQWRNLVPEV